MASAKDIYEAKVYAANMYAAGVFRGVGSSVAPFIAAARYQRIQGPELQCGRAQGPAITSQRIQGPRLLNERVHG